MNIISEYLINCLNDSNFSTISSIGHSSLGDTQPHIVYTMFSIINPTLTTESMNSNDKHARQPIILLTLKMTHQVESADIQVVYPTLSQTTTTTSTGVRYVITSRIPTVTYEEITQSLVVMNKILEIFREILTENDKQL